MPNANCTYRRAGLDDEAFWVAAAGLVGSDDVAFWDALADAVTPEDVVARVGVFFAILRRVLADDDPLGGEDGVATTFDLVGSAAQDWFAEGIDPRSVEGWLAAGCWRADRVRALVDARVTSSVFYAFDGSPLLYDEARMYEPGEAPADLLEVAPLAVYVMDGEIAPGDVHGVVARMR